MTPGEVQFNINVPGTSIRIFNPDGSLNIRREINNNQTTVILPPGKYIYNVLKSGYSSATGQVLVLIGQSRNQDVKLVRNQAVNNKPSPSTTTTTAKPGKEGVTDTVTSLIPTPIPAEIRNLLAIKPFVELKGKLPWPVEGEVISRFGSRWNANQKTVTENTGIDISSSEGTEVRSVYDAIVTTVKYIRGYGNTVILDHGDGFYSLSP
jgi:murein DD-endopeptidase MepM/ murein hydrolase activator NlpD